MMPHRCRTGNIRSYSPGGATRTQYVVFGPTRVCLPNRLTIGSYVFAQSVAVRPNSHRRADSWTMQIRVPLSMRSTAISMTLPSFAAERRRLHPQLSIDAASSQTSQTGYMCINQCIYYTRLTSLTRNALILSGGRGLRLLLLRPGNRHRASRGSIC